MKGLQEQTESGVVFLVIKHNSIIQESKHPKDGFDLIEVVNPKTNKTVTKYIKRYSAVEAAVTKLEWYDTEQRYENRYQGFKIHMDANETPVVLDLAFNQRSTSRFMKLAENIDWNKPVEFRAWHDVKTDSTAFWVGQNGENVPQKYTRDNPGDCPEPVQNARGKWNYDAQMDWLQQRMINVVIPAVQKANEWRVNGKKDEKPAETEPTASLNGGFDFEGLKGLLKSLAEENPNESKDDILENWFGVRSWSELQKLDPAILHASRDKIIDHLVPF